ncbi:MAG: bacillithiol biosynthesis BshC, partial [Candidatus Heimdallarchaeota archaeon]
MSDFLNPNHLYDKIIRSQDQVDNFWGEIPRSYGDVIELVKKRKTGKVRSEVQLEKLEILKKFLIQFHKDMGIVSQKVLENIQKLDNGSILMGQQPIVFGGPGFIGNKFGCLAFLDRIAKKEDLALAPIFFIGDYDGLQKELTRTYFPNPISQGAVIIDASKHLPEDSNIAVHRAEVPPLSWLMNEIENLSNHLRGFQKQVKGPSKFIFEERWDHLSTILKTSFQQSNTLSEWATRIWGYMANIVSDLGIVFLPTSHPEVRKLVASEYLRYLSNGELYANTFQAATDDLEERGYKPTLPHRHSNYAPFMMECIDDGTRITTTIVEKEGIRFAEGTCSCCDKQLSYKVTTEQDLNQIATIIGPRVDS